MNKTDYVLAKFLDCSADEVEALNTIVLDVDEFFDDTQTKTLHGLCKAVYEKALSYLKDMYDFVKDKLRANPNLYDGSVLEWDANLLNDSISYLDPKKDLTFGISSYGFYMELDNWELYNSVVNTINEDYNSGYDFKYLINCFSTEFYGGKNVPEKYDSLLL